MINQLPVYLFYFCSVMEIVHLRQTCKYFYKNIPKEWTIEDLYITESIPLGTKFNCFSVRSHYTHFQEYVQKCKFIENIYVHKSHLAQIHIHSLLDHLTDLIITGMSELNEVIIKETTPQLKNIIIVRAPRLKNLILPSTCKMHTLNICSTQLDSLFIHPSWNRLKRVILRNVGSMDTLEFPVECTQLEELDIIDTRIQHIRILGIIENILHIQISSMLNITIYTPIANGTHIKIQTQTNLLNWVH